MTILDVYAIIAQLPTGPPPPQGCSWTEWRHQTPVDGEGHSIGRRVVTDRPAFPDGRFAVCGVSIDMRVVESSFARGSIGGVNHIAETQSAVAVRDLNQLLLTATLEQAQALLR
jgi:hypothetical protein